MAGKKDTNNCSGSVMDSTLSVIWSKISPYPKPNIFLASIVTNGSKFPSKINAPAGAEPARLSTTENMKGKKRGGSDCPHLIMDNIHPLFTDEKKHHRKKSSVNNARNFVPI